MKLDMKRDLREPYGPSAKEVTQVVVPAMRFLMIDGQGDPNTTPAYGEAIEALFALSYTIKFAMKKGRMALDYAVMPPEGLWWADDMADFATGERAAWRWTMMIVQPEFVTEDVVAAATADVAKKKDPAALPLVRFETYGEGLAAQLMHIGPFSEEGPTIQRVHDFIEQFGHERFGKHHEVYLSDMRRTEPAKWKTVVRQPMR